MGLSEYERAVLRRLDADLERRDPRLKWQLATFTTPGEAAEVSWRPPRAAVVVAAVMLAGVSFLAAAVPMLMRQPCRGAAATETVAPSRPSDSARTSSVPQTRPTSGHARTAAPSTC